MGKNVVGILTGGGDCPGLNSAIKAAAQKAFDHGYEVLGIQDGWQGLLDRSKKFLLDNNHLQGIEATGGTILGSSRTNPYKNTEDPKAIRGNFHALGLDALIAIGGEDTLGVANRLYQDFSLPIVGIPKTIDKDLSGTEYTLGFMSAVETITKSIDMLRTTASSHGRTFVVEVMGRHAGHLALYGGTSANASIILIPEYDFSFKRLCEILKERKKAGKKFSIIVVSEGAKTKDGALSLSSRDQDAFGHVRLGGIGDALGKKIEEDTDIETRSINLSHLQRGGTPSAVDRILGYHFGRSAMEAILGKKFGIMPALAEGKISMITMSEAISRLNVVDVERFYDVENYRAKDIIKL